MLHEKAQASRPAIRRCALGLGLTTMLICDPSESRGRFSKDPAGAEGTGTVLESHSPDTGGTGSGLSDPPGEVPTGSSKGVGCCWGSGDPAVGQSADGGGGILRARNGPGRAGGWRLGTAAALAGLYRAVLYTGGGRCPERRSVERRRCDSPASPRSFWSSRIRSRSASTGSRIE